MTANQLLLGFLVFSIAQYLLERFLGRLNYHFYNDAKNQSEAAEILNISPENLAKSVRYANDRYRLSVFREWFSNTVFFAFLALGGFGFFESAANSVSGNGSQIFTGLVFFFLIGICAQLLSLPFDYYATFVIEENSLRYLLIEKSSP